MTPPIPSHDIDGTNLLIALIMVVGWLLSIVVGAVWVFLRTQDGWKQKVRWLLVAGNLGGIGALLLAREPMDRFAWLLCAVSLSVAVLLVLRNWSPRRAPRAPVASSRLRESPPTGGADRADGT